MARSVGEAAAEGLNSGFRLAMELGDRTHRREREARLDSAQEEQLNYTRSRQEHADRLGALDAQGRILATEGAGLAAGTPDEATQQDFTRRVAGLNAARSSLLGKVSGYDIGTQQKLGVEDLKKLTSGDVGNANLTRAVTVSTGRPHTDYLRVNNQPAPVEQAVEALVAGLESGDQNLLLKGANAMYAPELRKGIGGKGAHGGTIVGKAIVAVDPYPGAPKDDPHVVPRLRVYVKGDKPFNGPLPEGAPPGATGYYDAPLTKNRSSDPNDPVRAIGMQEAMDWMHKQQQMVQLMNSPEAQQKLTQEQEVGDFDPNQYIQALASVGAAGGKTTTKYTPIPKGGSLLRESVDAKGNVVSTERLEGKEAPTRAGTTQEKIDAIDALVEDGTYTEAEGRERKRALGVAITTKAARGSGSGGGAGSKGGNIQSTKVDGDGYVVGVFRDGTSKRLLIDGKPWKSQDLEKRVDKLAHDLAQGINGLGKSASELREEARRTIVSDADAAPAASTGKPGGLTKAEAAKKFRF